MIRASLTGKIQNGLKPLTNFSFTNPPIKVSFVRILIQFFINASKNFAKFNYGLLFSTISSITVDSTNRSSHRPVFA